jgi:hypothetical protein
MALIDNVAEGPKGDWLSERKARSTAVWKRSERK